MLVAQGAHLGGNLVVVAIRDGPLVRWQVWDGGRLVAQGTDTPPRSRRRTEQALAATLDRLERRYGARPAADGRASQLTQTGG
nr:MAG: hypothetical protein DIU70_01515 [Bacillota bacterium]